MLIILVFHTVLTVMEELREFGADGECISSEPVAQLQYEPVAKLKYFHILLHNYFKKHSVLA